MNVDEAIEALLDVALSIFPGDHPNYDAETRTKQLRESVESILQTRRIPLDRKMQEEGEEPLGCKVYVLFPSIFARIIFFRVLYAATRANLSHPVVLRTYKPRGSSLNPTIVEAICATTTTPSYFSPISIGPRRQQQIFVGGPRGANNATRELLKEASSLFGKDRLAAQIVSLGCGRSHVYSMARDTDIEGDCRTVQEMTADCETVEKELSTRLCDMDAYLRLNVDRGMENLFMHKWDDLGSIQTHTSTYVETAEISEAVDDSLRRLQGSTGTVSLGEISTYSYTLRGSLKVLFIDERQIIQEPQRKCRASSISKRRT